MCFNFRGWWVSDQSCYLCFSCPCVDQYCPFTGGPAPAHGCRVVAHPLVHLQSQCLGLPLFSPGLRGSALNAHFPDSPHTFCFLRGLHITEVSPQRTRYLLRRSSQNMFLGPWLCLRNICLLGWWLRSAGLTWNPCSMTGASHGSWDTGPPSRVCCQVNCFAHACIPQCSTFSFVS